jgi:hypothetical protein
MFKWEVLEELTVEQWAKFKAYVDSRPWVHAVLADGRKVRDYLEADLHEFMVAEGLIKADAKQLEIDLSQPQPAPKPETPDAKS